jgi:two-component system phosphate regulon sensor histidine kinase PhoR
VKKRQIKYIIALLSFALAGIITVQLLWIKNTITENENQFNARVFAMLNRVVQKTARNEMAIVYTLRPKITHQYSTINSKGKAQVDSIFDGMRKRSMEQFREIAKTSPIGGQLNQFLNEFDSLQKHIDNQIPASASQMQSMQRWMTYEAEVKQLPLKQRLYLSQLEPILHEEKQNFNIETPMEYAVVPAHQDEAALMSESFDVKKLETEYIADIFPNDVVGKSPKLLLQFPEKNSWLIHSIQLLLILSLIFTLIIILAYYLTVRTIIQQRKVSEIKNDFINNMTHELKTPIATISLATDAMTKSVNESALGFTKIIKQESQRMHKHVEQILQMARVDKNEFSLNIEQMEINEFVQDVCDNQMFRIEEHNGKLSFKPFEFNLFIEADRDHFANVIYNLLDNAIKYTKNEPEISVQIKNADKYAIIEVKDNGIGMNKETVKHVFEKFYRATTGNVHDVKGFGLGLSYTKAVIDKLNGEISVKSEVNKGSTFTIRLPLVTSKTNTNESI